MASTLSIIWFFVIFVPGIYLVYQCMQCFDYEKILKHNQTWKFKIIYTIICIIIAFLFALCFSTVIDKIYQFIQNVK